MTLITINEAAAILEKSVQTVRRMIKQKRIHVKKQKTPQGFNYLIVKETLLEFLSSASQEEMAATRGADVPVAGSEMRDHRSLENFSVELLKGELERFAMTMQKLIEQNEKDKENFFGLIKTFQDRVFVLENQIKMLEAPKTPWWKMKIW